MKVSSFRFLLLILFLGPQILWAQSERQSKWHALIPDVAIAQYAGNIGCVSVGTGWDYGKNNRWETQLMFGYLPASVMTEDMFSLTIRESLKPWELFCKKRFSFHPAVFNFTINTVMNGEFWYQESSKYGKSYYHFSTALRFHLGLGSRINYHLPARKNGPGDVLSLYYEISTYDLAVISAFSNKRDYRFRDLLAIGVGIQYKFSGNW